MAVLTLGLTTVRAEFNDVFPGRDKATDGWIAGGGHTVTGTGHVGDKTGAAEYKDGDAKDEVRAIDVDKDLVPSSGVDWMELVIQFLVKKGRAGAYLPFRYFIYKGRIWRKANGWATEVYTGENKHTEHAHFSGDYTQTADEWTGSLGLSALRGGDMLVKKGDSGQEVIFWQYVLGDLGYGALLGEIDGDYGPKMEAAVNAYRKDAANAGPITYLSGWQGFSMLRAMMAKHAGKPGTPGAPGKPGEPGKDGVFTGALTITGGVLTAVATGEEPS